MKTFTLTMNEKNIIADGSKFYWKAPLELCALQKDLNHKKNAVENVTIVIADVEFKFIMTSYQLTYLVNEGNQRLFIALPKEDQGEILLTVFKEIELAPLTKLLNTPGIDQIEKVIKFLLTERKNICFTGRAGTGKYTIMQACTQYLNPEDCSILKFPNGGAIIFHETYDIHNAIRDIFDAEIHIDRDFNEDQKRYIKSIKLLNPKKDFTEIANVAPVLLAEYRDGEYVVYNNRL